MERANLSHDRCSADLFIGQVTCRIWGPDVAGNRLRARAEISSAYAEKTASGATPCNMELLLFELHEEFVGLVGPYFAESSLSDVTEDMASPELVGENVPVPADA